MNGRCLTCNQWPTWCRCGMTKEERLARAEELVKEIKRWADEASAQGGLKITADQAQRHALDKKYRVEQELVELLNRP